MKMHFQNSNIQETLKVIRKHCNASLSRSCFHRCIINLGNHHGSGTWCLKNKISKWPCYPMQSKLPHTFHPNLISVENINDNLSLHTKEKKILCGHLSCTKCKKKMQSRYRNYLKKTWKEINVWHMRGHRHDQLTWILVSCPYFIFR